MNRSELSVPWHFADDRTRRLHHNEGGGIVVRRMGPSIPTRMAPPPSRRGASVSHAQMGLLPRCGSQDLRDPIARAR